MNRFVNWKTPQFSKEGWAFIFGDGPLDIINFNWLCFHPENLRLGVGCDVGAFTLIQAKHGVEIGDDVEIGPHSFICSYSTIDDKRGKVVIKKGAKIGTHSTIMPKVTIGKNAVIGAYSFVNKDIPDDVIAYGVPCKVVKKK